MSAEQKLSSEWIQVGELVDGFGGNELQPTSELSGRSLDLHFDNHLDNDSDKGWIIQHRFLSPDTLEWEVINGEGQGQTSIDEYRATSLRPGIVLVDFIKNSERATSVSLVLDLNRGIFTAIIGTLPTEEATNLAVYSRVLKGQSLTPVDTVFMHGSIDTPVSDSTPVHQQTTDLVGKSVLYDYGEEDSYEHHYLNPNLYTWHCVKGAESGLADTDKCHYYKVDEELYLFVWREKVIPTLGVIMVDFNKRKTTGKLFGYKSYDFGELSNGPVGAHLTLLNDAR
ncbi:molybdenum cofactor biosynthesis protein F [Pseudomaricurvus alkylphenolicus]|uniref:molybdenum cofactor biosynthesis F family protein n=1 Tax=Pseudomaricurvus alkylphenolicus TaxID=1306991 RepID=UPI00142235F8|nr:molybdenum cofactor biosynthesis F family protein [Pseudomaricurvus alkylphenolicus]NIB43650.1 molybdenum cofactor biosynthesis protein F [Pseudomaricurvus alkylphenolicus]